MIKSSPMLIRFTNRDYSKAGLDKFKFYYEDIKENPKTIHQISRVERVWNWLYDRKLSLISTTRHCLGKDR